MKPSPKDSNAKPTSSPKSLSMRGSKHPSILIVKRRYLILEDQFKQMQNEYDEKKKKI